MPINFPADPTIQQRYSEHLSTWFWDGTAWVKDASMLSEIWPVGSIYMTSKATLPPQFTEDMTWQRTAFGRGIVGVGQYDPAGRDWAVRDEFGEDVVTVSADQMPAHAHGSGTLVTNSTGSHNHSHYYNDSMNNGSTANEISNGSGDRDGSRNTSRAGDHSHSISGSTASAGSGASHNNIQPSVAYYIWERVA
jgi:microcystin-dependent protein